jgi:hypothetical protein
LNEQTFVQALESARQAILAARTGDLKSVTPREFEKMTYEALFNELGAIVDYQEDSANFPDIVCDKEFGVEVKVTGSNRWTSTGNSILESTRNKSVKIIYLFFLKQGGQPDIKYRKYQDCLNGIAVTHSPRYKINMTMDKTETIFAKMGVEYDDFRGGEPIAEARKYYGDQVRKEAGTALWWVDEGGEDARSPIIKDIGELEDKKEYVAKLMALFPEVLKPSGDPKKFQSAALYAVTEDNRVSKNFRDHFTAGGKVSQKINGKDYELPAVWNRCFVLALLIRDYLLSEESKILSERLGIDPSLSGLDRIEAWKRLADEIAGPYATDGDILYVSDVLDAGLAAAY